MVVEGGVGVWSGDWDVLGVKGQYSSDRAKGDVSGNGLIERGLRDYYVSF